MLHSTSSLAKEAAFPTTAPAVCLKVMQQSLTVIVSVGEVSKLLCQSVDKVTSLVLPSKNEYSVRTAVLL